MSEQATTEVTTPEEPKLGVGINENVILASASVNKDKRLQITWKRKDENAMSAFDRLNDSAMSGDDDLTINTFGFKVPDDEELSRKKKVEVIQSDIQGTQRTLKHILSAYMPLDQIKFNAMAETGITANTSAEEWTARLLTQTVLDKIATNIFGQFCTMIAPFVDNENLTMRLKLRRQSKKKHYPAYASGKFVENEPFIEPASVPKAQSKVKFSDYEIKEGLDKGHTESENNADAIPGEDTAQSLFNV